MCVDIRRIDVTGGSHYHRVPVSYKNVLGRVSTMFPMSGVWWHVRVSISRTQEWQYKFVRGRIGIFDFLLVLVDCCDCGW